MNVLTELTKYFSKEQDVYVQNVSNGIVSLSFGEKDEIGYSLPFGPNPIVLTSVMPFEFIKKSITFRKALLRKPPFIKLMTYEEYQGFYAERSKQVNIPADELIEQTQEKQRRLADRIPEDVPPADPTPPITSSTEPETLDEVLTPRVIQIVANLNQPTDGDEGAPINIPEVMNELDGLALKYDDLEYVRSMGRFKTIKQWAGKKIQDLEDSAQPTVEKIAEEVNVKNPKRYVKDTEPNKPEQNKPTTNT